MRVCKSTIVEFILFHLYIAVYVMTFPIKDSWTPTVALLILVMFLMITEYVRTKLFVSPLMLWYAFWMSVTAIGRMDLNLYPFYQTWDRELLTVVIANTLIFFWLYWLGERDVCASGIYDSRDNSAKYTEVLCDITIVVMLIACLAFLVNVVMMGCIPQLTEDPNSIRGSFITTRYYSLVNIARFSFALVPVCLRSKASIYKKIGVVILALIFLAEEMLSGWRTFTMQAMILLLTSFFLTSGFSRRKNRAGNVKILVAAGCVMVLFIGYIAVSRDGVSGALREKISYVVYILDMYIAPNFLNFQTAMHEVEPIGKPLYSTIAVWSMLPGASGISASLKSIDQSIGAFNVSTYLLQPFADLGVAGTLIWSSGIAFFSGLSFRGAAVRKNIFAVTALGLMNITIFLMHNNLFLRSSSIIFWLILAAGIHLLTSVRKY